MGIIQSVICNITFCLERILTWTSCAFALLLLMFAIIILTIYGITIGYHYAQKELSSAAVGSLEKESKVNLRSGPEDFPVVRFVAVNDTEFDVRTSAEVMMETTEKAAIVLLQSDRPLRSEMSPNKAELARRLLNRMRRARSQSNNITASVSDANERAATSRGETSALTTNGHMELSVDDITLLWSSDNGTTLQNETETTANYTMKYFIKPFIETILKPLLRTPGNNTWI